MHTPKNQTSNDRESAAQMWIKHDDGNGAVIQTEDRYTSYSQYGEGSHCAGRWHWCTWGKLNSHAQVSGIADTEEQARQLAELHHAMTDDELIEIVAREHLDKLQEIGYRNRASIDYSTGYDDGFRAALAKLGEFLNLNIEVKEQEHGND